MDEIAATPTHPYLPHTPYIHVTAPLNFIEERLYAGAAEPTRNSLYTRVRGPDCSLLAGLSVRRVRRYV